MSQPRQSGISFDDHADPAGIIDFGPVQATWFKDSEGNLIQGTSPLWSPVTDIQNPAVLGAWHRIGLLSAAFPLRDGATHLEMGSDVTL